jgi:signal transduction histidine kinase/CheY-like chemotaxis protein
VLRDSITTPHTVEFQILLPDGSARWIESQARSALDPAGQATTVIGVAIDITRRRKVERERDELVLHLSDSQKIESIGLLTGGIAHDFNNVLSSILGYSSLARDRYAAQLPEKLLEYLTEIQSAGERGRDMVTQLLAFGRVERTDVAPVDLQGLVEQTLKMVRSTLPATIQLTTYFMPDLPPAATHPTQFQQVLLNLCINARDAMEGSGRIVVTLHEVTLATALCASCGKVFSGKHVLMSVVDAGPGIPDAIKAQIFDPFFSSKTNRGGTGMGLAMVHSLVHSHGGHIVLDTAPGQGARFNLYFRVTDGAGDKRGDDAPAHQRLDFSTPLRALVIDDEGAVGNFFAEVLRTAGHDARLEVDPLQALETFCASPDEFDLVITDQTMPNMSGADLAQHVLALRPAMPVILLSGFGAGIDADKAHELGIRTFLQKPISATELMLAIHNALRPAP